MTGPARTRRSAVNVGAVVATQVALIGLSFATRTAFVTYLGPELLGVQTLIVSLTALLTVADLGVGAALMHSLYEPLASRDLGRIAAITAYGTRVYRWIAACALVVGVAIAPVLPRIGDVDSVGDTLYLAYSILLIDTIVGMLIAARIALATASQQLYLVKFSTLAIGTARAGGQIFLLSKSGGFLGFLLIQAISSAFLGLIIYYQIGKAHPYLRNAPLLACNTRSQIRESVRAMLVYRVGGVLLHQTDPIIVSALVGTIALGYYSNYLLVASSLAMMVELAFSAVAPSVGDLFASEGSERALGVLGELSLLANTVYGMLGLVLLASVDEAITQWLGHDFSLGTPTVAALSLNVLVVGSMAPIWAFRTATGMFRETQFSLLATAGANLALSIVLGSVVGIPGVLAATAISRILCNSWYEPWVLLTRYLKEPVGPYVRTQAASLGTWIIAGMVMMLAQLRLPRTPSLIASACIFATAVLLAWMVARRTAAYADLRCRLAGAI